MDQTASPAFWAAIGAVSLGCLGALFGGLAGALARASGYAAGGVFGHAAAEALQRVARKELSPVLLGAVVGAADGALFLGLVGAALGVLASRVSLPAGAGTLPAVVFGVALLALGAVFFGGLAYGLLRAGMRSLPVLAGLAVGGVVGADLGAGPGALLGLMIGSLLGLLAAASESGTAGRGG
jgi:hypothetical protein